MRFFLSIWLFFVSGLSASSESSYPYISGYTWWHFCEHRLTQPDFGKSVYTKFDPLDVKSGDTIFVEYNCLEEFAREYLPKIQERVILITSNYGTRADMPLPGPFGYLLEEKKIVAWFVQNIDREPTDKLIPMPIGLASNYWPHGNHQLVNSMIPFALRNKDRPIFIYLNFSMSHERESCRDYFNAMGIPLEPRKSYASYLRDLTKTVFVISPPGGGIDCHRTWEALLFGCYPVLQSTTLDPLFEDLPVVIVKDWEEVTPELLEEKQRELGAKKWSREKLYSDYWFKKVRALQEEIRSLPEEIIRKIEQHDATSSWKELYYDVLPRVIRDQNIQTVLEVGVALGGHAEAILKNSEVRSYIGVDPYQLYDPNDGFQIDVGRYGSFDYLYRWVKDIRLKSFGKRARLIREKSTDAARQFEDESLDCIFIDGDHRYEAVLNDLRAWFPKLKKGHLMLGDDYWMKDVAEAVDEFFQREGKEVFFFESKSGYRIWAVHK